jgi:hypothetical protein
VHPVSYRQVASALSRSNITRPDVRQRVSQSLFPKTIAPAVRQAIVLRF